MFELENDVRYMRALMRDYLKVEEGFENITDEEADQNIKDALAVCGSMQEVRISLEKYLRRG